MKKLLLLFWSFIYFASTTTTPTIIDIDWKFKNILILPAGCPWAKNVTWRVHMRCPPGHFFVPTRLQASTNKTQYCVISNTDFTQENGYSLQFDNNSKNKKDDSFIHAGCGGNNLKQVRRVSSQFYGDGRLNRYDQPYFPLYLSPHNNYWDCVGAKVDSCSFQVEASQYVDKLASHGEVEDGQLATLVLPGPYCSTVDSFEHYDRFSGGVVFKTVNSSGEFDVASFNDATDINNSNNNMDDEEDDVTTMTTPSEIDAQLVKRPHLRQTENIFLVTRGRQFLANASKQIHHCVATLIPSNVLLAKSLWARNRTEFRKSIIANIHISFIQVTYNGYSTFYDDMTALQHDKGYWEGMFDVVDFYPLDAGDPENLDGNNNTRYGVKLVINYNVKRLSDQRRVRIGLALYEFLVLGDDAIQLLGEAWPYRYTSQTRDMSRRLLLLRNATIDRCYNSDHVLVADFEPVIGITTNNNNNNKTFSNQDQIITNKADAMMVLSNSSKADPIEGRNQQQDGLLTRVCPHNWCIWLWIVLAIFVIVVVVSVAIVLFYYGKPATGEYDLEQRRRQLHFGGDDDDDAVLVGSALVIQPQPTVR